MRSVLRDIQDTVIKYANIIAHVIDVDVEIVDANLCRIAGTGAYSNRINEDISNEGFVYKTVLASGQPQFIEEPGRHKLCLSCPKQLICAEKLEMCTPIRLRDEIIGVIGLICFNDRQKQHLLANKEAYREFLGQIAEFISIKAYEKQEAERNLAIVNLLNQVVNNIDKGVLILDKDNIIVHANGSAMKQLALSPTCFQKKISLEATGDSLLASEEFKITIDNKVYYLIGDIFPVRLRIAEYSKVLIFNEIKKVKSGIYELTNIHNDVRIGNILGGSEIMRQLKAKVLKIAASHSTVLITGESGTGKEMFARAIHAESSRQNYPFVAINCGAIPDTLLESELFGYVKGAFTGADPRGKIGKFELANKGVIFLDEIGDMPLYLQVKLLRVLQERKITRIGSNQVIDIDVRVIAATNKDLRAMIKENKFREDLFYRLNVIPLEIPPLRERKENIAELVMFLVAKYARLFNKKVTGVDEETMRILERYSWPGNVRELENTVEFMINMMEGDGILTTATLPKNLLEHRSEQTNRECPIRPLKEIEREAIEQALKIYGVTTRGKQLAARQLGIGIATLYRKIEEYSLS
ncbi:sigma 54-interacting transcriptional regulator [Sporolituus thermophilus]|uniref:Transcriptional regulator containing PAS, AAA-type ATPase, and DNA-binding Fis domains n=1 Tax=Sporolituus thermophilus DSM 23256 TaxID=1123285 RepID=A0A1G7J252_9FIRM|nr:sigma 54-interacting transcriptional regulator [Sporolituus thermophilus]SDF18971.1 Transcriptional regulator containing PAS, AAA-type ATPase, and DNA-binding Fis domains [Sporolituus thermophilus DSM 23256]